MGENGGVAEAVEDELATGFDLVLAHGLQQFGAGWGERMVRGLAKVGLQALPRGECDSVLLNEAAEGTAEAFVAETAGEEGEVDVAGGFVPGAEGAGGDVLPNAFGGAAEPGKFPVMDDAGAVGGEVGEKTAIEQLVQEELAAVFDEVGAVDDKHGCISLPRAEDAVGALLDLGVDGVGDGVRAIRGFDEHVGELAQAVALGEGQDPQPGEIERVGWDWHVRAGLTRGQVREGEVQLAITIPAGPTCQG
jgi:hypothetical protein